MSRQRRKLGFTIIELLVVMAVISVLVGLILPAVQNAREAARRSECTNHLKQLALGLHNYHDAHSVLPPGAVAVSDPQIIVICASTSALGAVDVWAESSAGAGSHGTSWMLHALPYLEHSDLYGEWNFETSVSGNRSVADTNIPLFYCPSRRSGVNNTGIMFESWSSGGNDYGGCVGGCNGWHNCGAHESWIVADGRRPGGECAGLFGVNSSVKMADIADGTSNTIMLGEVQRLDGGTDVTTSRDGWAVGASSSMFSSCSDGCLGPNTDHFEEMGSAHSGGAFVAMADGAVRFVSDSLNVTILRQLGSRSGDGPSGF